jgi:hypothetical protein
MAFVADIAAIGAAVFVTVFAVWMLKQLLASNNN